MTVVRAISLQYYKASFTHLPYRKARLREVKDLEKPILAVKKMGLHEQLYWGGHFVHRITHCTFSVSFWNFAVQCQKAVSAYFTSKQILPFGFAKQRCSHVDSHAGITSRATHTDLVILPVHATRKYFCVNHVDLRFFQFAIILKVLVSSFWFI